MRPLRPSISIIVIPSHAKLFLRKLRASRGHLDGLRPEDLFPHDQDHYGGLAATDELARGAQVSNGSRVADFCAGLGGTVRYLLTNMGPTSLASN